MIEVAKAHEGTCQEYQMHKQAHSGSASNYANPLLQTHALSKSFQKYTPKRPCGKCGRSHGHGDCPAQGSTCNNCGKKNHWSTICRSSGRRHSLSGRTLSHKDSAKCQAAPVLAQDGCRHHRLHKKMPGMYQAVTPSQRAITSSRCATAALGTDCHGLFLLQWQAVHFDM